MRIAMPVVAVLLAGCGSPEERLRETQLHVARNAEEQYRIIERTGGTPAEKCMRARLVAEAYLQAMDEKRYDIWRTTAGADCAVAGLEATR